MKEVFRHIFTIAFVFILCLSFAFAQQGTIKGTVLGSEGALQSATVAVEKVIVLTDENGFFSISLKQGHYSLAVSHVGYKKAMQEIIVTSGNTHTIDLTLSPVGSLGI